MIKAGVAGDKDSEGHNDKRGKVPLPIYLHVLPSLLTRIGLLASSVPDWLHKHPDNRVVLTLHHVRSLISNDTKTEANDDVTPPEDRVGEPTHQAC